MMARRWLVVALVVALPLVVVLSGAACSSEKRPAVAATVEGATIKSSDTEALLDAYLQRQTPTTESGATPPKRKDLTRFVLYYQIRVTFVEQLAAKLKAEEKVKPESFFDSAAGAVDPEAFKAFGLRPEDFARSLRAGRLSQAIAEKLFPDVTVSEEAVKTEFERRSAEEPFKPWKAKIKAARFTAQEPADKVRERVGAGESFDQVASVLGAEKVDEVEINPNLSQVPPPVIEAIEPLAPNQVSPGVQTTSGWLAILVERRETITKPTLEEVRPDINDYLVNQERARLFQDWFDKQFKAANVTVAKYYGKWNAQIHNII